MPPFRGNYKNYHGPASQIPGSANAMHVRDVRLSLLDSLIPGLFTAKNILDIGCNAGNVSCQLGFYFGAASVTGVDIDPELLNKAENQLALRASRVRPATEDSERVVDYYPLAAVLQHGYLFEPRKHPVSGSQQASTPARLPDWPRVSFFSGDWAASSNRATDGPYDVILALSVIKWIHLEHGDEGLVSFFRKCASSLATGGYLVIELQPWESYEKAVRPTVAPHFKETFRNLKYRPETSFSALLQDQGLHLCNESDALPRRIYVYRKA